ncbi:hypothetical protein tinsulaeT_11180 [Thalassotalea insulae]|uniref:TIGR02281 family clan AA aspartic protease n=1 Tax=Thalassotalea insulae TaxID=2056778 RepID=A0ABQ6GP77_9GAMM|nr:retropepsin-like aspartic protease [Thalassotalea insulae]GLX77778.1 hypothetical protein tinsulaeT_11180 [Thalassotalea insulae]
MPAPVNDNSSVFGRYFIWLAWIIAIILLIYLFQDLLEKQWNPNQQPEYRLTNAGQAEVVLQQNHYGHYVTQGTINGYPVTFLLDTGATSVSIPAHLAKQLELTKTGSYLVQTANGSVRVFQTHINELTIGNIILNDVNANINPGMQADEILLGMSALKKVEFTQSGKQLVLRQ